jgi:hypothetical protein
MLGVPIAGGQLELRIVLSVDVIEGFGIDLVDDFG